MLAERDITYSQASKTNLAETQFGLEVKTSERTEQAAQRGTVQSHGRTAGRSQGRFPETLDGAGNRRTDRG